MNTPLKFGASLSVILSLALPPTLARAQFGGLLNGLKSAIGQPTSPSSGRNDPEMARNQARGCAAGGALGGALGALIGAKNRFLGGMVGGVGGCLIASAIAKQLTENERQQLQERTQDIFESDRSKVSYQSSEQHKMVTVERGAEVDEQKEWDVEALQGVAPPSGRFTVVGRTFYAAKAVNLHTGPSLDSEVIGTFRRQQAVFVMGRTPDHAWDLIGSDGVLVGYAAADLFSAHPVPLTVAKKKPAAKPVFVKKDVDLSSDGSKVKLHVATTTSCAQARQQVGSATGLITGCKSPNGGWNLA